MISNYKVLPWAFAGLACFLLAPNLVYGVREAHDIKYHLALFLSYRDAVELGTLYPRWLPDQLHGLGSPALLIYPPLASAFFVLIDVLTAHTLAPERLLGLGAVLLSIASFYTFYLWARKHVNAQHALLVALFYATAPYHLNLDLYDRGAMAEYTTFVWIPLIFVGIRTSILIGSARGAALLAISACALFLTHLLTAMLIAPVALAYALVCLGTELTGGLRVQRFVLLAATTILGVGLAAFYYVPAMLLLPQANSAGLYRDVATTNILFALQHGSDRFGIKLLLLACAYLLFFLYLTGKTLSNWRKHSAPHAATALALMWIFTGVLCFALMSGLFPFVFYPPSPYAQIQFGWRLLVVMEFSLISLVLCCIENTQQTPSHPNFLKIIAIMLIGLGTLQGLDVVARFHNVSVLTSPMQDYPQVKWRLSPIEYFPIGTQSERSADVAIKQFEQYAVATQPAFIATDAGKVISAARKGAEFTVHSFANRPTKVMIQQFYFPGWIALDQYGVEIAVFRDEVSRLASYTVPAGEHTVVVKRVTTREEHWGNLISWVALILLAIELLLLLRRRKAVEYSVTKRDNAVLNYLT